MEYAQTLIDKAAKICGSRYALAKRLSVSESNLTNMVKGNRPIPPSLAGELAAITGDDPRNAALSALVEKEADESKRQRLTALFGLTGGEGGIRTLGTGLPYA